MTQKQFQTMLDKALEKTAKTRATAGMTTPAMAAPHFAFSNPTPNPVLDPNAKVFTMNDVRNYTLKAIAQNRQDTGFEAWLRSGTQAPQASSSSSGQSQSSNSQGTG
jgi:hypothetical protein